MIEYRAEEYSDVDGNRGIMVSEYELDEDDYENIRDILIQDLELGEFTFDDMVWVTLDGNHDDPVEFEVYVGDYFTKEEIEKIKEEYEKEN